MHFTYGVGAMAKGEEKMAHIQRTYPSIEKMLLSMVLYVLSKPKVLSFLMTE